MVSFTNNGKKIEMRILGAFSFD